MNFNWNQAITSGVIAATVPLVLKLMVKYFPDKQSRMPTELEFSDKEVQKWNFVYFPIFISSTAISTLVVQQLTVLTYHLTVPNQDIAPFFIGMPDLAFFTPAFFISLVLTHPLNATILKKLLKDRYELYLMASTRKFGAMNNQAIMKFFSILVLLIFIVGNLFLFQTKLIFLSDHFTDSGILSNKNYEYSQISEIGLSEYFTAPNGNLIKRQILYLKFKNGFFWSSFFMNGYDRNEDLAAFLSLKSNVEILRPNYLPEN